VASSRRDRIQAKENPQCHQEQVSVRLGKGFCWLALTTRGNYRWHTPFSATTTAIKYCIQARVSLSPPPRCLVASIRTDTGHKARGVKPGGEPWLTHPAYTVNNIGIRMILEHSLKHLVNGSFILHSHLQRLSRLLHSPKASRPLPCC